MNGLQKRNKGRKGKHWRRRLSGILCICLSAILLLSDSLPAYAAGADISAGDGILWEAGNSDEEGVSAGDISSEDASSVHEGDGDSAGESGSAGDDDSAGGSVSAGDGSFDGSSVSGGDGLSVSAGDADIREAREPESFYKEPEPENYGELVSYDAYSRTYHAGGNQYVTVIGNDGTTYIDEDGVLRRVDNALVENPVSLFGMFGGAGTSYINSANAYTVLFPENMAAYGGGEDSLGGNGSSNGNSDGGSGIAILCGDFQMMIYPAEGSFAGGIARGNAIRYSDVFPGVDYQYTVFGNSVKEDIILLEKGEKNSFSYYVDSCGLSATLTGNTLYLHEAGADPERKAVFVLEAPEMEDAAGEISFGVKMTLSEADGLYLVTVTADREWLDAPERVYPVRIDQPPYRCPAAPYVLPARRREARIRSSGTTSTPMRAMTTASHRAIMQVLGAGI